jgi:hypothetical protein
LARLRSKEKTNMNVPLAGKGIAYYCNQRGTLVETSSKNYSDI